MNLQKFQVKLINFKLQMTNNLISKKRIFFFDSLQVVIKYLITNDKINKIIKEWTINDNIGKYKKDEITQEENIIPKQKQIGNLNEIFKDTLKQYESISQTINKLSNQFQNEELQEALMN
ncbi:unnamed protein product [Paramecium sonneborni]|uniref:Uncharacterized protein n=1 Tax=Paramecium sonneborni TaxID=65129 RepID=A0A8S1RVP7_9CILI|nr:unnamed protein product [Paramecium sonneborni]